MERQLKVGQAIVFIDSVRRRLPALVQAVHGEISADRIPCINLLHISADSNKTDNYGRQIEHVTSCSHASDQSPVVGYCWHFTDEDYEIDEGNVQTQR